MGVYYLRPKTWKNKDLELFEQYKELSPKRRKGVQTKIIDEISVAVAKMQTTFLKWYIWHKNSFSNY